MMIMVGQHKDVNGSAVAVLKSDEDGKVVIQASDKDGNEITLSFHPSNALVLSSWLIRACQ